MIGRIRSRLGSAHLIAVIALVMAITGTSIALPGANSVDSGDIKPNAVTSSDIRAKNVKASDVANNALTGTQVNESALAEVPSATVADQAANVLWAVVSNPAGPANSVLARSSQPAPTITESTGVIVAFNRSVSGCAWTATRGSPGTGVQAQGFAQTGGAAGNANGVDVRTRDDTGTIADGDFHLVVVCP